MTKKAGGGVLAVVSAYAPKDERDVWEARVYLRLVFEDLALLFDFSHSVLVGCLSHRGRTAPLKRYLLVETSETSHGGMSAPYTAGCAAGCTLSRGHYGGCVMPSPKWSGTRTPCSAGHDNDVWCDYCTPREGGAA